MRKPAQRQRGVALIVVMWVIALMGILLGAFALIAHAENLQARHMIDATTARYAAIAGMERAVYELRNPDIAQRWSGDGRPYVFDYEGVPVQVEITDESGKIDINVADATILVPLFLSVGLSVDQANALSDAIQDWRDADDQPRINGAEAPQYAAAGLNYGPTNRPFQTVSEIQQVLGMNYDLYKRIEPAITIYSGQRMPNAMSAPIEALLAIPGMTMPLAQQIITTRQSQPPGTSAALNGLTLPPGMAMAGSSGLTYSIKSRAALPSGADIVLDATIRLGGVGVAGRPYTVLRWRDGERS